MALPLRNLKPRNPAVLANPPLTRFFSSNSSTPSDEQSASTPDETSSESSFSSYFSDVKARLKEQQQKSSSHLSSRRKSASLPNQFVSKPSQAASLEEIRKNLSEFRRRSSLSPEELPSPSPSSSPSPPSQHISLQELYNRNVAGKAEDPVGSPDPGKGGRLSFDAIRESLKQLRSSGSVPNVRRGSDSMSLSSFQNTLKLKPSDPSAPPPFSSTVIGGAERLPKSVFGKEIREKKEGETVAVKTEFVKMYSYKELGDKLRTLRSADAKEGNWFSLTELNNRLVKLREMEQKEAESRIGGISFRDLRESLVRLKMSDDEKSKKSSSLQRLDILGRTPDFMLHPPKGDLVERYFHPDNMSSAEKMKLELAKVREEFKMSESDCGSARVQIAQLTTKIKHLSSVLHKKDNHSRKGLLAMVQKRKKLLKYLRRKDWDSYCLVLSRLGLRDNPEYKH